MLIARLSSRVAVYQLLNSLIRSLFFSFSILPLRFQGVHKFLCERARYGIESRYKIEKKDVPYRNQVDVTGFLASFSILTISRQIIIRIPMIQTVDIGGDKKLFIATSNMAKPVGTPPIAPAASTNINNAHAKDMINIDSVHKPILIQISII